MNMERERKSQYSVSLNIATIGSTVQVGREKAIIHHTATLPLQEQE